MCVDDDRVMTITYEPMERRPRTANDDNDDDERSDSDESDCDDSDSSPGKGKNNETWDEAFLC